MCIRRGGEKKFDNIHYLPAAAKGGRGRKKGTVFKTQHSDIYISTLCGQEYVCMTNVETKRYAREVVGASSEQRKNLVENDNRVEMERTWK